MLDFCDAPYCFFPPKPSRPLIWIGKQINRFYALPCKEHRVHEIHLEGNLDAVREAQRAGDRLLFVINHPTHSDPQVITEMHRRLGVPLRFMAAYDVFLRTKFNAWCVQKLGHFSIDREGSDRKAMTTAIDTLKEGDYALDIFPEGNVYLTNDRVTPFLDGTAFIALKAQQALDSDNVRIIPVSLKYTHLTDCREQLVSLVESAAKDSGFPFDSKNPVVESVVQLGSYVLASHLARHGYADQINADKDDIHSTLADLTSAIVVDLETALDLSPKAGDALVDRIRKTRSNIHQIRTDQKKSAATPDIDKLADKAILAYRILAYLTPYLPDHPSLDRFSETVERIGEDHFSKTMGRTASRRAIVSVRDPLNVSEFLEQAGGKLRGAVAPLTAEMERSVQAGLDEINENNTAPGAMMME